MLQVFLLDPKMTEIEMPNLSILRGFRFLSKNEQNQKKIFDIKLGNGIIMSTLQESLERRYIR